MSLDTMVLKHKKSRDAAWVRYSDRVHFVEGEMRSLCEPSSRPQQSIFVQKQAIRIQLGFADGSLSGQIVFDFIREMSGLSRIDGDQLSLESESGVRRLCLATAALNETPLLELTSQDCQSVRGRPTMVLRL